MNAIKSLIGYVRRERATSWMLAFIIVAIAAAQLSQRSIELASPPAPAAQTDVSTPAPAGDPAAAKTDFKKAGEEVMRKLQGNKRALCLIGLTILLVISAGLAIDAAFLLIWRKSPPPVWMRKTRPEEILWFPGDVFKAVVVMFFSELVLSFLNAMLSGFWSLGPEADNALLMAATLLRNFILILYVVILVRRRYGARLADLGLHARNFLKNAALGAAAYLGFLPIYCFLLLLLMAVIKLLGVEPPVQQVVQIMYEEERAPILAAFGLLVALLGPVFEEAFFRGFAYQAFKKRWGVAPAMIVVSILFAVLHAHWVALLPIFALSLMLCFLFEKTGSLVPGITLHVLHNALMLGMMFGMKGLV